MTQKLKEVMETKLSSVDSLLEQAGLLSTSLKPAASVQENDSLTSSFSSGRAGSITDLDADLLGVKLDDCSRYFKKEIMVSVDHIAVNRFRDSSIALKGHKFCHSVSGALQGDG